MSEDRQNLSNAEIAERLAKLRRAHRPALEPRAESRLRPDHEGRPPLGRGDAEAAGQGGRSVSASFHAIPRFGRWALRRRGKHRASRLFASEQEAWAEALVRAKEHGGVAWRHGQCGRIVERVSFVRNG